MGNAEVRNLVLCGGSKNNSFQHMRLNRLRWLCQVLCMVNIRPPFRGVFYFSPTEWKKPSGGHQMAWQRRMRKWTANFVKVGPSRFSVWDLKDPTPTWLEILKNKAVKREQGCNVLAKSND